jgi:hypothetical protein
MGAAGNADHQLDVAAGPRGLIRAPLGNSSHDPQRKELAPPGRSHNSLTFAPRLFLLTLPRFDEADSCSGC